MGFFPYSIQNRQFKILPITFLEQIQLTNNSTYAVVVYGRKNGGGVGQIVTLTIAVENTT